MKNEKHGKWMMTHSLVCWPAVNICNVVIFSSMTVFVMSLLVGVRAFCLHVYHLLTRLPFACLVPTLQIWWSGFIASVSSNFLCNLNDLCWICGISFEISWRMSWHFLYLYLHFLWFMRRSSWIAFLSFPFYSSYSPLALLILDCCKCGTNTAFFLLSDICKEHSNVKDNIKSSIE